MPNDDSIDKHDIGQTLHLQQIIRLPEHPVLSGSGESVSYSKRPPRPQPQGLKMRFKPIGFGSGKTGNIGLSDEDDFDEDMVDATAKFPVPAGQDVEMGDAETTVSAITPKSKKSKKSKKRKLDESSKKEKSSSSKSTQIDQKQLKDSKIQ